MAPRKRYQLDRVTVESGEQRASTWTFGGEPMSGTEQAYRVQDGNFRPGTSGSSWSELPAAVTDESRCGRAPLLM